MRQAVGAETVWKNRRHTRRGLVRLPLREAHNLNGQLNGRGWGSQFSKPFKPKRLMPTGRFNFGVRVNSVNASSPPRRSGGRGRGRRGLFRNSSRRFLRGQDEGFGDAQRGFGWTDENTINAALGRDAATTLAPDLGLVAVAAAEDWFVSWWGCCGRRGRF